MIDSSFIKDNQRCNTFEHAPNQTITFWGNFRFCFSHPSYQLRHSLLPIFDHSEHLHPSKNIFSSENKNFNVCSFLKFVRIQLANVFLLPFWMSVINGSILFLKARHPRSSLSILCTLLLETSSSMASFRVDNRFLPFKRRFTFWIIFFVRTKRWQPGGVDSWIDRWSWSFYTIRKQLCDMHPSSHEISALHCHHFCTLKVRASVCLYFSFYWMRFEMNRKTE